MTCFKAAIRREHKDVQYYHCFESIHSDKYVDHMYPIHNCSMYFQKRRRKKDIDPLSPILIELLVYTLSFS